MAAKKETELPEPAEVEADPDVEAESAESAEAAPEPAERWESFEATRPGGEVVIVKRNIDTGEQSVTAK